MPVQIRASPAKSAACEDLVRLTQAVKSLHPSRKGFQLHDVLLGEGPEGFLVC